MYLNCWPHWVFFCCAQATLRGAQASHCGGFSHCGSWASLPCNIWDLPGPEIEPMSPVLAFLVAQMVKNLPVVQETQVLSLGREDPLEEEMATHSSILTGRIPWTEEPGGLQSMGSRRVGHD